jgi:hypothetical protein
LKIRPPGMVRVHGGAAGRLYKCLRVCVCREEVGALNEL